MNPVKEIGRYKIPILSVVAIKARDRTGWRRFAFWIAPGFDVFMTNGATLHFTPEEKAQYDRELEQHELVVQVYGACVGAGLRGGMRS